jgi:hypothetical protein
MVNTEGYDVIKASYPHVWTDLSKTKAGLRIAVIEMKYNSVIDHRVPLKAGNCL